MPKVLNKEEFIKKARKIHGDKYDYSKVEYVNAMTPVCIICPEHGEFMQRANTHLTGHGCPKCVGVKKRTSEDFINDARKIHGDKYDYSKVVYKTMKDSVCIICPEHGEFWQLPENHLSGCGCTKCKYSKRKTHLGHKKRTTEDFINDARKIHGDKYDYSKVKYIDGKTPICIICPEHGEFMQRPDHHLTGHGCPKCSGVKKRTTEDFINDARKIHGDKYDYSKVEYINSTTKVCIICPEHGEFWQTPTMHLNKSHGCPMCANGYTKDYKLSLLESGDLLHMSSHQLIEIIANKKLPDEFRVLAYSPADSDTRVGKINELIALYESGKSDEEIDEEIYEMEDAAEESLENSENEDDFIYDDNIFDVSDEDDSDSDDESTSEVIKLPSIVLSNTRMYDDLLHMKPSDESAKFIVLEETHKLWNSVLRANEDGTLLDEIEKIKSMEGGEFMTFVKNKFMEEYDTVTHIEKDADYKFPYDPSLMQRLMVYYLQNNKSFGNWCGTGAGKTNAFLFATRKTNSHITVAIVPNDVIDTLVKSIKKIYPDSNVVVPKSIKDIHSYDRDRYTYIIYNYEKFQGNNGASKTIDRLLEKNAIDFICLDEVQNVKIRNVDNASSRSQFINDLIIRGREINPEMKTLVMSATPCINNLYEVRSIIEILTGVEHDEIGIRNSISNIHNAYKALLINGFRYVPKYPIVIEEKTIDIDCTGDDDLYMKLSGKNKGDISGIEYTLALKKLDSVKNELHKGTIVYATWVDGMCKLLTDNIRSWGYSVESYNGESGDKEGRKEILDRFLTGKTDILVCSKPISTGVDGLQYMCNKMVIVSLPWTDADYTQLKGRIYRQGSVFKKVEFVIPQIVINLPEETVWSWDKMRKYAIDTKKSLGSAVVDGLIQDSYNIDKDKLLESAIAALEEGLEDVETERRTLMSSVVYAEKERKHSESFINEIHREANSSSSETTHKKFSEDRNLAFEYHKQREIAKTGWVEDPVDRVAEIISKMSGRYGRVIDLGCGMNKLRHIADEGRIVHGVDHVNVSGDSSVIEADICHLDGIISNNSYDVAVFCLSLWGTNYKDYFSEAHRILDVDGKMIIVEPSSKFGESERYGTIEDFISMVEDYGFERVGKVETRNNFVYFKFTK